MMPQLGHLRSGVLGLDLAIIGDTLQFLAGEAALPISADLIRRLQGMVEGLETKAEQAEARAEEARAQVEEAVVGLRDALLAILDVRGIPCPDGAHARIQASDDPATLRRWLGRARTASSAEEVFAEVAPGP